MRVEIENPKNIPKDPPTDPINAGNSPPALKVKFKYNITLYSYLTEYDQPTIHKVQEWTTY